MIQGYAPNPVEAYLATQGSLPPSAKGHVATRSHSSPVFSSVEADETLKLVSNNRDRLAVLALQGVMQGTVPYLGTFLTDLTMLDAALQDHIEVSSVQVGELGLQPSCQMLKRESRFY